MRIALALSLLLAEGNLAGIAVIDVHGQPFMALPTADGAALFVSVVAPDGHRNEIDVYHRVGTTYTKGRSIQVEGTPLGLALTPDGHTLLVADSDRYLALSVASAEGDGATPVASISAGNEPGAIEVVSSPDGRYAFFSNESSSSVGVVRIEPPDSPSQPPKLTLAGVVLVDHLPVGLALTPDGKRLYVTSEFSSGRARSCGDRPPGTLDVIDVGKAEVDPAHAVLSSVVVGCGPVRVAVSNDGATVWVTVRGENVVAAFDAATLLSDPTRGAIVRVGVGTSPVGLLLLDGGRFALIANSNRFDRYSTGSTVDVIDTRSALAARPSIVGRIPTGSFPRELRESAQRDVIYLTNFNGGTVEVISEPGLPGVSGQSAPQTHKR